MRNLDFWVIAPYFNLFPEAVAITLKVGIGGFILTIILSIIVGSLRTRKLCKAVHFLLAAYVEFFRGTPLLVQLFIVYYGLPSFGIKIGPMTASIVTMGLNSGAYLSEVVRAAILSVDRGQYEASAMLGYNSLQTTMHIILPQALRIAVPSFMNGFSSMIKKSLISVLPVVELTKLAIKFMPNLSSLRNLYYHGNYLFCMTYSVTFCKMAGRDSQYG